MREQQQKAELAHEPRAKLHNEDPGRALRRVRESMHLKYRDVEEASQEIARLRANSEFAIGLSRLADIEHKGTLPSLFRLYSLCAIYGLSFPRALGWYGIDLDWLNADAALLKIRTTRPVDHMPSECPEGPLPLEISEQVDLAKTFYLNPTVERWGKLPLKLLRALDLRRHRYAFIGTDDWSMYPILTPGCFVQIDETKTRLSGETWSFEHERPIHFVEHREGFRCGWCTEKSGLLIVQSHPASHLEPDIFKLPGEADVIGQVIAVAMRLDLVKRRHTRF